MRELTRDVIVDVIYEKADKWSKDTSEVLIDNIKNYGININELNNEQLEKYVYNTMVPISTVYQLCLYTMSSVLSELLCNEEKADESSNESNEIILDAGKSLTVINGNHRIEINDNGVVVFSSESGK